MYKRGDIPKRMKRSLITTNSELPYFYHLIKTHKLNIGNKIRPVISNCNGPTKKMAWFYQIHHKTITETEVHAHLEYSMDSIMLIQTRNSAANISHPYPFSLDVIAFIHVYSSPVQEAIQNVFDRLEDYVGLLNRADIYRTNVIYLYNIYFNYISFIFFDKQPQIYTYVYILETRHYLVSSLLFISDF